VGGREASIGDHGKGRVLGQAAENGLGRPGRNPSTGRRREDLLMRQEGRYGFVEGKETGERGENS